jgi:hypothetical protein
VRTGPGSTPTPAPSVPRGTWAARTKATTEKRRDRRAAR